MGLFVRVCVLAILVHYALYGAAVAGIWVGETTGRNGEKQDIAFQFKTINGNPGGVMFGDEADLPVESLKVDGDNISFSVTTVNYYSGSRLTLVYSGTLSDKEMKLTRERKVDAAGDRPNGKQEITLKRVAP
jgi:hypothetical protein